MKLLRQKIKSRGVEEKENVARDRVKEIIRAPSVKAIVFMYGTHTDRIV